MAKLIDPIGLIENPKNTPMYVEIRDMENISFQVAWSYDEKYHTVGILGSRIGYGIDEWNKNWRAWDAMPTKKERMAKRWMG